MENAFVKTAYIELSGHVIKLDSIIHFSLDPIKDYVIIENNNSDTGLLIKTIEPKIRGVAISCEGGDDINVQQQIYSTIEAILDVSASDISISKLSYSEE